MYRLYDTTRPAPQRKEEWKPRKHPRGEIALVDADMHVSVKGCIEETGEAVDDCILGDLKLDTGVSTIVNLFIRIRVDKSEDLFRFTELVDVVHLHHIPDARSASAGAHPQKHTCTHAHTRTSARGREPI